MDRTTRGAFGMIAMLLGLSTVVTLGRPVTAIRAGDTDGNDATAPDPTWESFKNTPPLPDTRRRTAWPAAPPRRCWRDSSAPTR